MKTKLLGIAAGAIVLIILVGFTWLAVADVPVQATEVSKTIPNERFFNAQHDS